MKSSPQSSMQAVLTSETFGQGNDVIIMFIIVTLSLAITFITTK